ncbi:hypothetical protein FRC12_023905 [Ceratobasidium sp. 428]|nr:hypothetical protein FRC12_023905 [Ceratobasidium sp. 428]
MPLVWPSGPPLVAQEAEGHIITQRPSYAIQQIRRWPRPHKRALGGQATSTSSRDLIIVGIVFGTISVLILVGLVIYIAVRSRGRSQHQHRHRHSVAATSRIRNGYTRARVESGATDGSRCQSTRNNPTVEPKTGYFKSWSKSTKTAYLSVPTGINDSYNQLILESSEAVYRYDPEAVAPLPRRKRKKSSRSRLGLLAPSPKLNVPPRQPLVERTNKPSPPIPERRPVPSPPPNRAIRPRAELRMGHPSLDARMHSIRPQGLTTGTAGLGSFVPPPPPSWASFWPTESGFTGFEGEPSMRDEDFGDESGEDWASDESRENTADRESKRSEYLVGDLQVKEGEEYQGVKVILEREASVHSEDSSDDGEGQYALDTRSVEQVYGHFRLTPRELQGRGRTSIEIDPIIEGASIKTPSPQPSQRPEAKSPYLDLGDSEDSEADETTHLAEEPVDLQRAGTGRYTMAFGESSRSRSLSNRGSGSKRTPRSSTGRSGSNRSKASRSTRTGTDQSIINYSSQPTPGHSRNASGAVVEQPNTAVTRSSTGVTRSSTAFTDVTDSSTGSGEILSVLTGRLVTPLLRSMQSLRRVAGSQDADTISSSTALPSPSSGYLSPSPYTSPIRRLPPIPSSSVPPVPPIPQHYLGMPIAAQSPESENIPSQAPAHQTVQRTTSLSLPDPRALPNRPAGIPHATIPRSVSMGNPRRIRPLPVPPLPSSGPDSVSSVSRL